MTVERIADEVMAVMTGATSVDPTEPDGTAADGTLMFQALLFSTTAVLSSAVRERSRITKCSRLAAEMPVLTQ